MNEPIVDVIIIGSGPAGLQAAIHAVRKKASVLVLGRPERSSLAGAHVENYLGVEGVSAGEELVAIGRRQALAFGARLLGEDVLAVRQEGDGFVVESEGGGQHQGLAVILATGTARKKLKVKGEKELAGRGVSYCVDCDANFFRNQRVAVVGNESAAADGALTLTRYARQVTLIARELAVSDALAQRLAASPVEVRQGVWVQEVLGEQEVAGLLLDDGRRLELEGVFVELGAKGALELATSLGVDLDPEDFTHILVDRKGRTNLAGVYAAGDITGHPYQMAKAVGEGCVAGWEAANYARSRRRAAGG
ncbi:MAG: FAD-dependent oxidoreductase [Thermodesulfobacteriota bacterium]